MGKTIVFCADGTWDGPGAVEAEGDPSTLRPFDELRAQGSGLRAQGSGAAATNVFKLFINLAGQDTPDTVMLAKEQERILIDAAGVMLQIAKYIDGVGDVKNFVARLLGGTLGTGLIARIVRGYTFISRNYVPGDKIYIVGFSRGAYTARALAGLIAAKGLLDAGKLDLNDKAEAYRLGSAVWYAYRRAALQNDPDRLGALDEMLLDLPHFFMRPPGDDQLIAAPMEAVAVWETVGALGIPEFTSRVMRVDLFRFADTRLSDTVRHGLQALAVDERRADFTPTLWDPEPRITQVLFPGAHSDVGGGYPTAGGESGLSDRTLAWMTDELARLGVAFAAAPIYRARPDPKGTAHEPCRHGPWAVLLRVPRRFPTGLCLAQFVLDRINDGPVVADPGTPPTPYYPTNISDYLDGRHAAAGIVV
jgi:uncharacterized protein (DUF2235 family)